MVKLAGTILLGVLLALSACGKTATPTATPTPTPTLAPAGSMTTVRSSYTATLLANGKVLVAGGRGADSIPPSAFASAELYDPTTGTFSSIGSP